MSRFFHQLRLLLLLALLPSAAIPVCAQKHPDKITAEEYENRQRALSLILYDSRIKSLEDAPIRCSARTEVIRFLVQSGPKDLYPYAVDSAVACLEETVKNADEFNGPDLSSRRTGIISLVRKIDKEKADKLESEYPVGGFAKSILRDVELSESDDPAQVAAKVLNEIRSGTVQRNIGWFITSLRKANPTLADTVLEAVIVHYENHLNTVSLDLDLVLLPLQVLRQPVSLPIRHRFLVLAVNIGRRAFADRSDESFVKLAIQVLGSSIQAIESDLPESIDEARSILQTLKASESVKDLKRKEIYDRIEASDDKLATAISEAEEMDEEPLRSSLWKTVSELALRENKLRIAVDAAIKLDTESEERWRRMMLENAIPKAALGNDDLETVEYIYGRLEDPGQKSGLYLLAAEELEKKEKGKEAIFYFRIGLAQLTNAEASTSALALFMRAARLCRKLNEGDLFAIAREAVETVNALPSPSAEDLKESKGRRGYVNFVTLASASYLSALFDELSGKDPDQSYTISQGIQRRDLRTLAEISVEKFKKYPLPEEKE